MTNALPRILYLLVRNQSRSRIWWWFLDVPYWPGYWYFGGMIAVIEYKWTIQFHAFQISLGLQMNSKKSLIKLKWINYERNVPDEDQDAVGQVVDYCVHFDYCCEPNYRLDSDCCLDIDCCAVDSLKKKKTNKSIKILFYAWTNKLVIPNIDENLLYSHAILGYPYVRLVHLGYCCVGCHLFD